MLTVSSFTCEFALLSLDKKGRKAGVFLWLLATFILGAAFLGPLGMQLVYLPLNGTLILNGAVAAELKKRLDDVLGNGSSRPAPKKAVVEEDDDIPFVNSKPVSTPAPSSAKKAPVVEEEQAAFDGVTSEEFESTINSAYF